MEGLLTYGMECFFSKASRATRSRRIRPVTALRGTLQKKSFSFLKSIDRLPAFL